MNITETKQLLQQYYNLTSENFPQQRVNSEWKHENNFGFLLGIIVHGLDVHIAQLRSLLLTEQFKNQEQSFIDSMLDFYIRPFHKNFNTDSECCQTASQVSSKTPSRSNSIKDLDYVSEEKELSHDHFNKALAKRDGVCLFCWGRLSCERAYIITQKNYSMADDEKSLLMRAGLTQKQQVQNGLLLCVTCHSQFDKLKRYVDVVDDKLVIKIINEANDTTSDKYKDWEEIIEDLKAIRGAREKRWVEIDNRKAVETNGDMALYFVQNNPTKLPNRKASEFHKTACLIWRMAGGAELDEEYCSDDEHGPINTTELRKRFKLPIFSQL